MGDIEQELKAYVSRRKGGRSAHAARTVQQAANCYRLALQTLRSHGNSSQQFWGVLNVSLSSPCRPPPGRLDCACLCTAADTLRAHPCRGLAPSLLLAPVL